MRGKLYAISLRGLGMEGPILRVHVACIEAMLQRVLAIFVKAMESTFME